MMGGTAYYLYCILPEGRLPHLGENGIDGCAVFVRTVRRLVAVLSEVQIADFCGAAAETHLMDLAWLAPRVCRHEAVIEEAMRQSPVLPARFATLFQTIASLAQFLSSHDDRIDSFFHWLGDRQEWGVKALVDRARAQTAFSTTDPDKAERSPGAAFLRRKRDEAASAMELNRRLRLICQKAALDLQQAAQGFCERTVTEAGPEEPPSTVISNWAFVFPLSAEADFRKRLDRLNRLLNGSGIGFRLSGPWPPYSFAPALVSEGRA